MHDPAVELPTQFASLTPFKEWALATETQRLEKRLRSSMADIQAFYDAMLPLAPAILSYLNDFDLAELDEPQQTLMMLSLAEISAAVELYEQPDHPFGFKMTRFVPGDRWQPIPKER